MTLSSRQSGVEQAVLPGGGAASANVVGYAWVIVALGTLVLFGAQGIARFGYTVVLPSMQKSLGMNNTMAGMLATANLVGYLSLSVIGGALAAHFGPRKVITTGVVVAGAGMLLTGTAGSFFEAALWRGLTGVGSGATIVPAMGLMAAWFPPQRRGLATGIVVGGASLGMIIIGPVAPLLMKAYGEGGWRFCWYIFGAVTLGIALCTALFLRNRPDSSRAATTASAKGGGLQWGRVYRAASVWHLGFVYVAYGFSYIIYMTFFVKRLMADGGYSREAAGGLFMTMGWCSIFCGMIWGAVSDRIGRKYALMVVYLVHAVAFGLFALWPTPAGFTISAVLFGFSAWSIPAIMAAACGDVLGPRLAPAALGFITLFFGIGQAIGPSVAGAMADASGSFVSPFLLAAGVALLGALGAATLRPVKIDDSLQ
jgi:MFS family permease